jgi:hypothetical protein
MFFTFTSKETTGMESDSSWDFISDDSESQDITNTIDTAVLTTHDGDNTDTYLNVPLESSNEGDSQGDPQGGSQEPLHDEVLQEMPLIYPSISEPACIPSVEEMEKWLPEPYMQVNEQEPYMQVNEQEPTSVIKHSFRHEIKTQEVQNDPLSVCDLSHLAPIQSCSKAPRSRSPSDNESLGGFRIEEEMQRLGGIEGLEGLDEGIASRNESRNGERWCSLSMAIVQVSIMSVAALFSFLRPDIDVTEFSWV